MNISIVIKNCNDCKYQSHTGAFTKGGAKPCCNHIDTIKLKGYDCFKRIIPYNEEYSYNMTINITKSIPSWCPLKRGSKY